MKSKKDNRTREEKLRDLAANPGATNAEKNAALTFLKRKASSPSSSAMSEDEIRRRLLKIIKP